MAMVQAQITAPDPERPTFEALLERGNAKVALVFPRSTQAEFLWWIDGVDERFIARFESCEGIRSHRLVIYDDRSGDQVCASMPNDFETLDPLSCHFPDHAEQQARRSFLRKVGWPAVET